MKKPHIEKFMSTDEWRAVAGRGGRGNVGIRKAARFGGLQEVPASEDPGSLNWFSLSFDLPFSRDRFGDWINNTEVAASGLVSIGFGFDADLGSFVAATVKRTEGSFFEVYFKADDRSPFWEQIFQLASQEKLDLAIGLLPGSWELDSPGFHFNSLQLICIQFLPPAALSLSGRGMEPIREWMQRIANGPPEKSERYELVVEALRDLPAPAPEADPDQVMLEAMQALTAALKEATHELRCLQGKTE